MNFLSAERSVNLSVRSVPRSTLFYFSCALIGAFGLTVVEQTTKIMGTVNELAPPTIEKALEPAPQLERTTEPAKQDEVKADPPPVSPFLFPPADKAVPPPIAQGDSNPDVVARLPREPLGNPVPSRSKNISDNATPFAGMAGVWSGGGTVTLDDGSTERIRCRATYAVGDGGTGLNQTLTCASDSYRINLASNVVASGGSLSGTWSETSRNVSGAIEGRASKGSFQVTASAPRFTANISLTTSGNKQKIQISAKGDGRDVLVTMVR
jgi:hypothetical protein